MDDTSISKPDTRNMFIFIINTIKYIIINPVTFFRNMPKQGSLTEPLLFTIFIGIISGVIFVVLNAILYAISDYSLALAVNPIILLIPILLTVIITVIYAYVFSVIFFLVWKLLGSNESYKTAYRSISFGTAIFPIALFLTILPYIGIILGVAWIIYLLFVSSIEVHYIKLKPALICFGIIYLLILPIMLATFDPFSI